MAGSQMRAPVLITSFIILMVSLTGAKGSSMKQSSHCRAVCTDGGKNDCITLNQDKVDLKTAKDNCQAFKGELLEFQSKTDKSLFDILSRGLFGNYWIGLHLPAGACSNLSAPLRGYKWVSGEKGSSFIPSWDKSAELCSPHCVSLTGDQKWTEQLCSDIIDGFLCKTKLEDACRGQEVSHPTVFQSSKDCSSGPCEHDCKKVQGGYTCSCFHQYIPDSKNPKMCKLHCAQQRCPAINDMGYYLCPDGFLKVESEEGNFCEDVDECDMRPDINCNCKNTYGSFECSCREGFVLKDQVKCIKFKDSEDLVSTTLAVVAFVKPPTQNNTLKASSAPAARFLWLWIVAAVAVIASVFTIWFYVVKRRRQRESSNQQSSVNVPVGNIEC
ncbi:complement component C1q receptor-like [Archocentrus centrarchus]|uniref:complement component C1q receptor-like n=1 Tax=Archocentrus centrarchus TaxID=63155 RepID=UPI0011EA07E1|nr:complement component C1q receptor-like [Archocentrus centrarchus]